MRPGRHAGRRQGDPPRLGARVAEASERSLLSRALAAADHPVGVGVVPQPDPHVRLKLPGRRRVTRAPLGFGRAALVDGCYDAPDSEAGRRSRQSHREGDRTAIAGFDAGDRRWRNRDRDRVTRRRRPGRCSDPRGGAVRIVSSRGGRRHRVASMAVGASRGGRAPWGSSRRVGTAPVVGGRCRGGRPLVRRHGVVDRQIDAVRGRVDASPVGGSRDADPRADQCERASEKQSQHPATGRRLVRIATHATPPAPRCRRSTERRTNACGMVDGIIRRRRWWTVIVDILPALKREDSFVGQ